MRFAFFGDVVGKSGRDGLADHLPGLRRRPDLVITPLVGFDRFGGRLGQGGGHYDQALASLRRTGPVFVLGLAFAGQEVDRLALEPHDQTLDAILTEAGYRRLPQA